MDRETRAALARGKVVMTTRHGRYVSEHDTEELAVLASLEDDRWGLTFVKPKGE